jgi:hypothetical protein
MSIGLVKITRKCLRIKEIKFLHFRSIRFIFTMVLNRKPQPLDSQLVVGA